MTATLAHPRLSVDEYFALELATELPNEYRAGEVVAIEGSTVQAGLIRTALLCALHPLPAVECVLGIFRLSVPARDAYLYPDLSVLTEAPRTEERGVDLESLINPALVIDVVTRAPHHADAEWRADAFGTVESIREYVRVASDRHHVAVYGRGEDGGWRLSSEAQGLDGVVRLESLDAWLPLSDAYRGTLDLQP